MSREEAGSSRGAPMRSIGIEAPRPTEPRRGEGHPAPATTKTENPATCWFFLCPPLTHSMSALHPIAAVGLVGLRGAATDPKRAFRRGMNDSYLLGKIPAAIVPAGAYAGFVPYQRRSSIAWGRQRSTLKLTIQSATLRRLRRVVDILVECI